MSRKQNEGMIRSSDPKDHRRLNTIIPGILNLSGDELGMNDG